MDKQDDDMEPEESMKKGKHKPSLGIRKRRGESVRAFITYLCKASTLRSYTREQEKKNEEFLEHCLEIYDRQQGLCAVSGVKLLYGLFARNPAQISIDRLDNARGYEIGNVRLVAWFVNNARGSSTDEVLIYFSRQIVLKHGLTDASEANTTAIKKY